MSYENFRKQLFIQVTIMPLDIDYHNTTLNNKTQHSTTQHSIEKHKENEHNKT